MGLLGIIVSAKFILGEKYYIKGQESITSIEECPIDILVQGGKIPLQTFLNNTQYTRILWYPQPHGGRVVVWQAERMGPHEPYQRKPYLEFEPLFGSKLLPVFLADAAYTAIGRWPKWLGDLLGTNTLLYKNLNGLVSQKYYDTIFPKLLPFFVPTNHESATHFGEPQTFQDTWYQGLPMDDGIGDNLFPVEFTELWIPMNKPGVVDDVLISLNKLFENYYDKENNPRIADGSFCVELYAAKANDFWLSPSYKTDVLRVDVFWFKRNSDKPEENYFPLFWEKLADFEFRPHWGKYLPPAWGNLGPGYLKKQYNKWDDFLKLRKKYDPKGIFLNNYWKEHLGLKTSDPPTKFPPPSAPIEPDANGFYQPKDEYQIKLLIEYAIASKLHPKKIRVRGAGQSAKGSIYTDHFEPGGKNNDPKEIVIILSLMRRVDIDKDKKQVTVQAGCNLGFDPYDPSEISTEDNSLFYQLREAGLAIPNVADAIHQTVGGFLSTGSAAGSTHHSFLEAVISVSLVDGTGNFKTYTRPVPENPNDDFYGVVVSMGLMGVIYSVTLKCVDFFHIKGKELVINDDTLFIPKYVAEPTGPQKVDRLPGLTDVLRDVEFARLIWWPFEVSDLNPEKKDQQEQKTKSIAIGQAEQMKKAESTAPGNDDQRAGDPEKKEQQEQKSKRIVIWQAHQMKKPTATDPGEYDERTGPKPDKFKRKPYRPGFYPSFLPSNLGDREKAVVELITELAVSAIFKVVDTWPKILLDLGNEIEFKEGEGRKTKELQKIAEAAWPKLYTRLLNFFMPINHDGDPSHNIPANPPQEFWDDWLNGLNNDKNEYSNNLLLANRTEVWVPLEQTVEVMNMLEAFYREQFLIDANMINKNTANVCYVNEILGGKSDLFWLSPGYSKDQNQKWVRINFYSLLAATEEPCDYFQQFWDLFFVNQIGFRLHWGYFLPKPGSPQNHIYLEKRYPKWQAFMDLRAKMDPDKIFVNQYWQDHLNIP
nr:D-arabinono-1,4-lactone oxidase [Flavisolibacter nicotianae]